MNALTNAVRVTVLTPRDSKPPSRTVKAAQEFEAQLLSTLLRPLEKSFSAVPGEDSGANSDGYADMGIQALATALSASGGIGIAKMVARQLMSTEVSGGAPGRTNSLRRSSL